MGEDRVKDRRPIAVRDSRLSKRLSNSLVRMRLTPNAISVASVVFAAGAGLSLLATNSRIAHPFIWFLAPLLIGLRLLANMMDGMVAIESGRTSDLGELFNEIPDRISDVLIFACAGYAAWSTPALGYLAAILSLGTAYMRALGNYMGVDGLFTGPMAKSHRMFTLSAFCLYIGIAPQTAVPPNLLGWGLALITAGSALTFIRRLGRIVREVQS